MSLTYKSQTLKLFLLQPVVLPHILKCFIAKIDAMLSPSESTLSSIESFSVNGMGPSMCVFYSAHIYCETNNEGNIATS